MDYFSRKSLSKYLMNTIEFNKHDVDIFINGTIYRTVADRPVSTLIPLQLHVENRLNYSTGSFVPLLHSDLRSDK
jgi:hypothetical protein